MFAAAVAILTAIIWLVLLLGRGFYWLSGVRDDERLPAPERWPSVVAVVPARNEAAVIGDSVGSLLRQDYPGQLAVVVVDDDSSDGTAAAAQAAAQGSQRQLVVFKGQPLPAGWTGKLWALKQGIAAAEQAAPDMLLLTDADIAHRPDSLTWLVAKAAKDKTVLTSFMAKLRCESLAERSHVPAFIYFFEMLYPFAWVRQPEARTAAAAGGCVLVRRSALAAAGGFAAVRDAVIDDVAVARVVARAGGRLWLGLADEVRSVRPYPRLADLWSMVARSAYTQLRHSPLVLAGTMAGLLLVYVGPPVTCLAGLATGSTAAAVAGGVAWLLMTASYLPQVRYARQPVALSLTLPIAAVLYLLMTVDSARRHHLGRGAAWKGRAAVG